MRGAPGGRPRTGDDRGGSVHRHAGRKRAVCCRAERLDPGGAAGPVRACGAGGGGAGRCGSAAGRPALAHHGSLSSRPPTPRAQTPRPCRSVRSARTQRTPRSCRWPFVTGRPRPGRGSGRRPFERALVRLDRIGARAAGTSAGVQHVRGSGGRGPRRRGPAGRRPRDRRHLVEPTRLGRGGLVADRHAVGPAEIRGHGAGQHQRRAGVPAGRGQRRRGGDRARVGAVPRDRPPSGRGRLPLADAVAAVVPGRPARRRRAQRGPGRHLPRRGVLGVRPGRGPDRRLDAGARRTATDRGGAGGGRTGQLGDGGVPGRGRGRWRGR